MSKLRIAITGATGLLGRNLLFEFLKQHFNDLDALEIFILGRDKSNVNIEQRIKQIILSDGVDYLALNSKDQTERLKEYCDAGIRYIDIDLDEDRLNIGSEDLKKLQSVSIDFFFHIAALTDFRDTPGATEALKKTNLHGTQQVLELISTLKIGEFCYTGTAYSCGMAAGNIEPDYINFNQKFRNPYESIKLEAEIEVRKFAKKTGLRCRYFRPSTICGRLIEPPLGAICKFDVFYGWAVFFFQIKLKQLKSLDNRYNEPLKLDIRICHGLKSGLNIVPADYAAKVMYQVCIQNVLGDSYHLVNNQETSYGLCITIMLDKLNIVGPRQADVIPGDMNKLERLYYKTVGKVLTPYATSEPMLFDTKNLDKILKKVKLRCPPVDEKNFLILINYAKQHDFRI